MASRAGAWNALRVLATQVAEALAAPAAASFVGLGQLPDPYNVPRLVEFSFQSLVGAGGVAADAVTFSFWRLTTGPNGNIIDLVSQVTIPAASLATAPPAIIEGYATQFWVTVQFVNGTTPNVSGTVYARGLD